MNSKTNMEQNNNYSSPKSYSKNSNNNIFDEVKEKVSIQAIADKLKIEYLVNGKELKGICPTGHPSFSGQSFVMNTETNLCHCFNCDEGGSIIDLVRLKLGCTIRESLLWIVDNFNLTKELGSFTISNAIISQEKIATEINRYTTHILLEEVVKWGKEKLYQEEGKEVLDYLTNERKYDVDKLKTTDFFYFPQSEEIRAHLQEVFPNMKDEIRKLPLLGALKENVRLAFPYKNRMGHITGIIKRVPNKEGLQKLDKNGNPQVNKNNEVIYERYDSSYKTLKQDLFGLEKITKTDTLLIVEGYPDAIYLPTLGYKNIVALGQGLFSERHIKGLTTKKIKNVILALDNDKVGPKNTLRAIDILLSNTDIKVYVLEQTKLTPHKDPDEYVKANRIENFSELVLQAEYCEMWKLKKIFENNDIKTDIGKRTAFEQALRFAMLIKDETIKSKYLAELGKKLELNKTDISSELRKLKSSNMVEYYKKEAKKFESRLRFKYFPFIEKATNSYAYYDRDEDEVSLGVGKDILENIMVSNGQKMPDILPVLRAIYNPKDDNKTDFENSQFNFFSPTKFMLLEKNECSIDLKISCPSIFRLLSNLIPKNDERERFINWLAGILQTREKQLTAWVFRGIQGTGKNVLRERVLQPLFGKRQVIQVEDQMLEEKFNGYLKNVMMIAFNEVGNKDNNSRNSVKSKIKAIITDKEIWINEKQIPSFPIENFVNCLFFSNEGVPVLIEEEDRRFNVINTGKPLREFSWFKNNPDAFLDSLSDEVPIFAQYLINYDYDSILAKTVFMNEEKAALINIGMNRFQEFSKYLRESNVDWFNENQETEMFSQKRTITSDDMNGKILKDLALNLFNNIYPKNKETKNGLTTKLEIHGIKAERLTDENGLRKQYYTW